MPEDGIYELRIPIKNLQYRILYFYFFQDKIILSHGLRKEDKVKKSDIKKAKNHKAEYFLKNERRK
jgi:phage-related protein